MKTLVLCPPVISAERPPSGAAIVCAICKSLGHDVTANDLNIKFVRWCRATGKDYDHFDRIFRKIVTPSEVDTMIIEQWLQPYLDTIKQAEYDYIMISVFTYDSRSFTELLCKKLKEFFKGKIVVGGMGLDSLSIFDNNEVKFGTQLKKQGLVDTIITGEAERSLTEYLRGQSAPGVDDYDYEQLDNLDNMPFPDYSYFDTDDYDHVNGKKSFFITGSRGCVRKCTFCDVERFWPKFRYRSGENIAREIIDNYERFGVTNFYFTDSLVNGNQKNFLQMCEMLAKYPFAEKLHWGGQFIFLPKKALKDEHFEMISKAGGSDFYVGLETGSDRVRKEMGKNFTNEDTDYQLEMFEKYNLHVMFLMFTGYLSETIEDHQDTVDMFKRWQRYVASGTIIGVDLGLLLIIYPNTPLSRLIDQHEMMFAEVPNYTGQLTGLFWKSDLNKNLDIRERIRRRIEINETAIKYNWPVWRGPGRLTDIKNMITETNLQSGSLSYKKIIDIKPTKSSSETLTLE